MPDFANMLEEISAGVSLCTMTAKDDEVEVSCPACRQRLRLPRHRVGAVECPRCGDRFEADTNTVVISDIDFGRFNIEPASAITYRIIKSRRNTGLIFVCVSFGVLSLFFDFVIFQSSLFNSFQAEYLRIALIFCMLSCVSWLVPFLGGKGHYIDIEPTEVYSSKLDIAIKYRGVDDIVRYFEPGGGDDRVVRQANRYLRYTDGAPAPVPQGDVQKLHINSYEGKSIDISRDYTAYMEAINDLIARRVAMAKASPLIRG
jgi:hypothetical protein